jgi:dihydroneopterin aldolase
MGWDILAATQSEDLKDALDYKTVSKRVEAFVQEQEFRLVEKAADAVANMVMDEFSVPWIRVSVKKPHAVTRSESVGVVVERGSHG